MTGKMSAHHYFREFSCADSGMSPWPLIAELVGKTDRTLDALMAEWITHFPCHNGINVKTRDAMACVLDH